VVYEQNINPEFLPAFPELEPNSCPLFLNRNGVGDRELARWHHRGCRIPLGSGQLIWPYLQLMMRRTIDCSGSGCE